MEENLQYLLNSRNQCSVTNASTSSDVDIHIQIKQTEFYVVEIEGQTNTVHCNWQMDRWTENHTGGDCGQTKGHRYVGNATIYN